MLTLAQLVTAITSDQFMQRWIDNLETLGIPASKWRKGGALRTIMRVIGNSFEGFSQNQVLANGSAFLGIAKKGWLTLLARYTFNVERIDATFASGQVTLTNGGGGLYTHNPRTFQVKNTRTGKVYTNTSLFTLNPTSAITIDIEAIEAGSASSSAPGEIDALVTIDNGVTVTNAAAVVGADAESDDALVARCEAKRETASDKGPRGAYEYAALSALLGDGTPVGVNRVQISASSDFGTVDMWVATPTGAPTSAELDAINNNVEFGDQTTFFGARPDSVKFTLFAAVPVPLSGVLDVWATATPGLDEATLTDLVNAQLEAMISTYPIGGRRKPPSTQGYLFAGNVEGTAKAAHPAIFDVAGATDLPINPGEVATYTATIVVHFVEGGSL
jgi:hypothetical protein